MMWKTCNDIWRRVWKFCLFVLLSNVLRNFVFGFDIGAFDTGAKSYNDVEER